MPAEITAPPSRARAKSSASAFKIFMGLEAYLRLRLSENDEVVFVHRFVEAAVAELGFDLRGAFAGDALELVGVVRRQAPREHRSIGAGDVDGVAAIEAALDASHAGRQQALVALG